MDMKRLLTGLALSAALGAAGACNNGSATPVTAPTGTTTTAPAVTETFSDNIPAGQSVTHNFTTTQAGEIDVTLTADAGPGGANVPLLVALGTASADGVTCSLSSTAAGILQLVTAPALSPVTTSTAGAFCFSVVDYYSLGPVTYSIDITHH